MPRAKKALGQNFLTDGRVVGKITAAAEIYSDDTILEVGPGRGILTRALASKAGKVITVEIYEQLIPSLYEKFSDHTNVEIVQGDARAISIDKLIPAEDRYKVVANLPYYAASPIVRRFLEADHKPTLMVVMVQREVGLDMTAKPGKMGILSVATQVYGNPRIITSVPPRSFRPSPKVTSAVVKIDLYDKPLVPFMSPDGFFELVRAGFSAPRKQIHNNLRHRLNTNPDVIGELLAQAKIDPKRRAQTLSITEWGTLYELSIPLLDQ